MNRRIRPNSPPLPGDADSSCAVGGSVRIANLAIVVISLAGLVLVVGGVCWMVAR